MTVDFTAIMNGAEYSATWAPHLDLIGGLIITGLIVILFMTRSAPTEKDSTTDDLVSQEEE
jgi:hypothetical protein